MTIREIIESGGTAKLLCGKEDSLWVWWSSYFGHFILSKNGVEIKRAKTFAPIERYLSEAPDLRFINLKEIEL